MLLSSRRLLSTFIVVVLCIVVLLLVSGRTMVTQTAYFPHEDDRPSARKNPRDSLQYKYRQSPHGMLQSEDRQSPPDVIKSEDRHASYDVIKSQDRLASHDVINSEDRQAPYDVIKSQVRQAPYDVIQSEDLHTHDSIQAESRQALQEFLVQSQDRRIISNSENVKTKNVALSSSASSSSLAQTYKNKTISTTKATISEIRQNRVTAIRRGCENRVQKRVPRSRLDHIVVDDRYEFLFCYIPKVGCSVWKKIFLLLTGKFDSDPSVLDFDTVHKQYAQSMRYLNSYPRDEIEYKIQNYKKAIFLRDPLERLLSAYRDKFYGDGFKEQFVKLAQNIVKRNRENATKEEIHRADDVTFEEFIKYVIDQETAMNDHWQLYTELCHPCYMNYDFVGNFETLNDDAETFLRGIGAPKNVKFPKRSQLYNTKKSSDTLKEFYSTIDFDMITELWKIYKTDYKTFGFSFLQSLKPLIANNKC